MSSGKYITFDEHFKKEHLLIKDVHDIPKSAVEVEEAIWVQIFQETDGIWTLQPDGSITKEPLPPLDPEVLADIERGWRDGEIDRTQWLTARHRDEQDMDQATTLTAEQFAELLTYRQALRDWPLKPDFPQMEFRPIAPSWIKDQVQ